MVPLLCSGIRHVITTNRKEDGRKRISVRFGFIFLSPIFLSAEEPIMAAERGLSKRRG
jgi:hypothetical protein